MADTEQAPGSDTGTETYEQSGDDASTDFPKVEPVEEEEGITHYTPPADDARSDEQPTEL